MKFLIACLGNIGPEYENTRHNVGFKIADLLAKEAEAAFRADRLGSIAEVKHKGRRLIVLKPATFMNLSGKAISYWLQAEKIPVENMLVVQDDIALPFGKLRMRGSGSDGGHNGLKNINLMLETQSYARLRFGVGADFGKGQQVDYVLGEWNEEENKELPAYLKNATEAVKAFTAIGLARAMNIYNTK
ncbi:MAG: aminoacyl-tRNA hydrolase [Prevotellaceae bacterium]|jgi:PTH1 family peptidyl-tRNA hydrolase|nr:aminoacyl-tRNA hydrolase [Prevotellaceae bacterium]